MPHQAVQRRILPLKGARPGVLAGHGPAGVVREAIGERRAAAVRGIGIDLLYQLLVLGCAHGVVSIRYVMGNDRRTRGILPIDSPYDIYSSHEFSGTRSQSAGCA